MPHIPTVVKSLKVMWIKRLLDPQVTGRWKQLTWYLMNVSKFELMCKFDPKFVNPRTPFYEQLLEYWYELHSVPPKGPAEICSEILWNNIFVNVNKEPVIYRKWCEKGILQLCDVIKPNGKAFTIDEIEQKYNLKVRWIDYLSLVSAIPKDWIKVLSSSNMFERYNVNEVFTKHKHFTK